MNEDSVDKIFFLWSEEPSEFNELLTLLKKEGWKVASLSGAQPFEALALASDGQDKLCCLAILDPYDYYFSQGSLEQINRFCSVPNNALLVASSSNESGTRKTNVNEIILRFGLRFNDDCVVRPNPYKQYHPREALLEDFIVNRGLNEALEKHFKQPSLVLNEILAKENNILQEGPRIVYAQGCTLKQLTKTSVVMMTSSKWTIPGNQAICTFYKGSEGFRMVALGSVSLMKDSYLKYEDNESIVRTILDFMVNPQFRINVSDAKTIEVPETNYTPDINQLADIPIPCLQVSEPLPMDRSKLIVERLFTIDSSLLPSISQAYRDLNVAYEPLTLLKPKFEFKFIELMPATHGFIIRRHLKTEDETDKGYGSRL